MIEIPLTKGYVTIIDDEDYEQTKFKWQAEPNGRTVYAARTIRNSNGTRSHIKLHRVLLGLTNPLIETDHEDGDGLNNRRYNLRISSRQQNNCNQRLRSDNTSGYKGIKWYPRNNKWGAFVRDGGKEIYLGLYESKEEAAMVRDKEAYRVYGEFAILNFHKELIL